MRRRHLRPHERFLVTTINFQTDWSIDTDGVGAAFIKYRGVNLAAIWFPFDDVVTGPASITILHPEQFRNTPQSDERVSEHVESIRRGETPYVEWCDEHSTMIDLDAATLVDALHDYAAATAAYTVDAWRAAVNSTGTTLGYDDWVDTHAGPIPDILQAPPGKVTR
jgi:hypothetical protein